MRDDLPRTKPKTNETAIVNLDDSRGPGTHWVCYKKIGNKIDYFDSIGNMPPPLELVRYFGKRNEITYNYKRHQAKDDVICGHLCLRFLSGKINEHIIV
jgi:hypothetical protein